MFKVDKRDTGREESVERGLPRILQVRSARGLRSTVTPVFDQAGMLPSKEREDLQIQHEVAVLFSDSSKVRFDEDRIERELASEGRLHDREVFESLCDASMAF